MARYKKKKQKYSNNTKRNKPKAKPLANYVLRKYDDNIFFIPTKANPNPVK